MTAEYQKAYDGDDEREVQQRFAEQEGRSRQGGSQGGGGGDGPKKGWWARLMAALTGKD
jgi:hypothetical protein